MRLDTDKARDAIASKVAQPLGLDVATAAEGIVRIIDVKMQEAIKAISTMRGHDLRDFMLVAFGGAGPVHAGRIARDLGMAGVIVPRYPGVLSALGLMMSDVAHDHVRSRLSALAATAPADVNGLLDELAALAAAELRADGFAPRAHADRARARHALCRPGLRDHGALPRPAADGGRPDGAARRLRPAAQEHVRPHGAGAAGGDRLLSGARRRAGAAGRRCRGWRRPAPRSPMRCASTRRVRFDGADRLPGLSARAPRRRAQCIAGPAILEQLDCTTVICPGPDARGWTNGRI